MLRRKILDTNSFYEDSLHWFCLSIYEWVVADAVRGVQLKFNTRGAVTAPVWIRSLLINGLRTCLSQTFLIEENKMGETWSSCREAAPLTSETCDQLWVIRMARYGAQHKWVKCLRWGGQGGGVASLRVSYSRGFTMDSVAIPAFLNMKTKTQVFFNNNYSVTRNYCAYSPAASRHWWSTIFKANRIHIKSKARLL